MMNYILHIGLPKTGTKYLQTHFRRHKAFLETVGVRYPSDWWVSKYDINHDGLVKDIIAHNDERLAPFFSDFEFDDGTVLLSCEGFSDLSEADLIYLRSLMGRAPVQIVLFCRRWSDWIPSAWQQTVKQGNSQTFPEFLVQMVSDARLTPTINFRIVLDNFANVFGRQTIAIVPYSNLLDENLNIVEVFYRHFLDIERPPDVTRESIHSSLGLQMAETVRALNSLTIRANGRSDVSLFRRIEEFQDEPSIGDPLKRIASAMEDCVGQIGVGDFNEPFNSLFQELTRDFADLVRDVGGGTKLFEPHSVSRQFVRPDYMLLPGVAEDIALLHERLASINAAEEAARVDATKLTLEPDTSSQFAMQIMQGEAAVDYLANYPLAAPPSAQDPGALQYDLKVGSVPEGMLTDGWSVPETHGTWTDGDCAILKLPRPARRGGYRMRLVLRPFLAPPQLPAQGFSLIVNGQTAGRAKISQFAVVEVSIPADVLEPSPYITVALETRDSARPRDLIGIRDQRRLALHVEQISMSGPQATDEIEALFPEASVAAPPIAEEAETEESRLSSLMLRFESLGENCEFGLVQRRCGVEPLGLFRFSSTPFPRLLAGLQSKFRGMGKSSSILIEVSGNGKEYMVLDKKYGFLFHAWVLVGERSPEEVKLREMRRIPFLVRKLTEDLTLGEKIFVYHGMNPLTLEQAKELLAALREYGTGTLLWVELADETHPPGTVEDIQPGLLKGYMDRFAPGENAHDLSLECWIELCGNASRLTKTT